jgi:hypothetical protein
MQHGKRSGTVIGFLAGTTLVIAGVAVFEAVAADAIGEEETTFVPMTPCRLVDTRPAPARVGTQGRLRDDQTTTIVAHGTNGDCTIPSTATGLSMNVTALRASAATYLTFWDEGERPEASSLNPVPGQPPTPNAVNVPLSATGTFLAYNAFGGVDIVVDVNGYYTNSGLRQLEELASTPAPAPPATSRPTTTQPATTTTRATTTTTQPTIVESVTASAHQTDDVPLGTDAVEVVAAVLEAPHDGKVTVTASANVTAPPLVGEALVECSISTDVEVEAGHVLYLWIPGGGPMAAVRTFDVQAGQLLTYRLVCSASDDGPTAFNADIAAVFTGAA